MPPAAAQAVDTAPLTVAAESAAPFSRHAHHRSEHIIPEVARSRCVVKGGRRLKVPVQLHERPPWDMSHRGKGKNYFDGDWGNLHRLPGTVRELLEGKLIESRLHAAFALARCSHKKEHRVPMATTPGVTEAIGHVLKHSEPTESGRRIQHHALTALHNMLLESKKVDVFIGHDDEILGGLLHCLETCDLPLQELAVACIDFLAVSEENQPILCFKSGMLDALCRLMRTTGSGYAVYHCLLAITYLTTCRQAHHAMARHRGVVELLIDTLCEHKEDPARCAQGAIALCNLMSLPDNAAAIEAEYNLHRVVHTVMRESRDGAVISYCRELDSRLQHRDAANAVPMSIQEPIRSASGKPQPPALSETAATPMPTPTPGQPQQTEQQRPRASKNRVSFVDPTDPMGVAAGQRAPYGGGAAYTPGGADDAGGGAGLRSASASTLGYGSAAGGAGVRGASASHGSELWDKGWGEFDHRWQHVQHEVRRDDHAAPAREVSNVSPRRGRGGGHTPVGTHKAGTRQSRYQSPERDPSLDPMALLDRYEAELNATMAEIDRDASYTVSPTAAMRLRTPTTIGRSPAHTTTPPAFGGMLSLDDDSDDESSSIYNPKRSAALPGRFGGAGRYGLGTFAVPYPASPNMASDLWSVSGDSDV